MAVTTHSAGRTETHSAKPIVIALLLLSLVMPFYFYLGSMRIGGYRLVLLIFFLPAMFRWLSGEAGRILVIDYLAILFSFWMAASLLINHGIVARWQFTGILVIETLAPYFIARTMIRDLESFRYFVWWFFVIILALLPFAISENITGRPVLIDLFGKVMSVYADVQQDPRMGLERAQTSMPHPILFGVFCAPAFALSWFVLGPDGPKVQLRRPFVVFWAVFASLSSGAFMAIILQVMLIAWNWFMRNIKKKWNLLGILFGITYFIVEVGSDRTAFQIFATHLTFSSGSAWNRINIFNNATDDIWRSPIFGIGLSEWTRPHWLKSSVDNFWLLITMRYGLPALALILTMIWLLFRYIGHANLTGAHARARTGYLIAVFGISVAAVTVHIWDATYCLYMFLLGAGVWFIDADGTTDTAASDRTAQSKRREIRYTRF